MKFLFGILALLLTVKECDQKKAIENTSKTEFVNSEETKILQQADYTIEYTAMSRGYYKEISVNDSSISVINGRGEEAVSTECSQELWNDIIEAIKKIDIKNISSLKSPTEHRFVDGAAIAKLKITDKDTTYISPEFDHGFPPEDIKSLCEKILSNSKIN